MSQILTRAEVLALAPDAASVKAAKKLLNLGKWGRLGFDEVAVWGECKGSGKKPYWVQVDRNGPAFKCSCPSRKFPCKHGLALFLIFADSADVFRADSPPERVTAWLESRQQRAENKLQRSKKKAASKADPAALKKRRGNRIESMQAGIDNFDLWLQDLVHQGLAALPSREAGYWREPSARLVDAKIPGMARHIRDMQREAGGPNDWPVRILRSAGRAYLLGQAFSQFEELESGEQGDIQAALGWNISREELIDQPSTREAMHVLGVSRVEDGQLYAQRIWLRGERSKKWALILEFAYGNRSFETQLRPGTIVDLELVFYPSSVPLRAFVKAKHDDVGEVTTIEGHGVLSEALDASAAAIARNPWLTHYPISLNSVRVAQDNEQWILVDEDERAWPLTHGFPQGWELMALAGGRPLDLFGEWRADGFLPLACTSETGFVALIAEEVE